MYFLGIDTSTTSCKALLIDGKGFIGNLVFLSLSKSKRDFYLTPLAPGVALLIGSTWESVWQWLGEQTGSYASAIKISVFLAGSGLVLLSFAAGNPYAINFPGTNLPHMPSLLMSTLWPFSYGGGIAQKMFLQAANGAGSPLYHSGTGHAVSVFVPYLYYSH